MNKLNRYNLQNPGDKNKYVIKPRKELKDFEVQEIFNDYMKKERPQPSLLLGRTTVIFDDTGHAPMASDR